MLLVHETICELLGALSCRNTVLGGRKPLKNSIQFALREELTVEDILESEDSGGKGTTEI